MELLETVPIGDKNSRPENLRTFYGILQGFKLVEFNEAIYF